jgi:methyl-accepting chemotaxis protein
MNIKTRLYFLTALNIIICSSVGVIGYLGIERLHPQYNSVARYRDAIETLTEVGQMQESLRSDILSAIAFTKTRNPALANLETIKLHIAEHSQKLLTSFERAALYSIAFDQNQRIASNRFPTEQFVKTAASLPDQLEKNFEAALPQLETFFSSLAAIEKSTTSAVKYLQSNWNFDHTQGKLFAHNVQSAVITTLLLGVACIIVLVLITLRSILQPIGDVINALGLSAAEVDISAQRMSLCAEDLAQSATEQAAAVQESVASMTQMSSMIAQTSDSSGESLVNVRRMADRTEDGNRVMERLASSTEAINQANVQLREMVDIIGEISAKTSVINDIVFKTQLLSFNASIEAARAGQHGRGFAVVAEEFGNLAEMSGQAAKEIQSLLETSKKHVIELVDMTHQRVSDGQIVSKEALAIFNELSRETTQITRQIQRISEATREQQVGVQQTSTAMNQMDQAAQRNSLLAGDTLRSASDLSGQSRKLTSIMQGLLGLIRARSASSGQQGKEAAHRQATNTSQHTHVLELNDNNISLDQAFLQQASNKLGNRAKSPFKNKVNVDEDDFQPYQGQQPR